MQSFFKYNGCRSTDFNIVISKANNLSSAAPKNQEIEIPGRNGSLLINNNEFEMLDVIYECWTYPRYQLTQSAKLIKAYLLSNIGYHQLIDSYDLNYYRMAYFNSAIDIEEQAKNVGVFNVCFRCKPFKQAVEGDTTLTFTKPTQIINPEAFPSLPIIKLYGSGNLNLEINNNTYTVTDVEDSVIIDSENMETYSGNISYNNRKLGSIGYPTLKAGVNKINFVADKIELTPRWRTL